MIVIPTIMQVGSIIQVRGLTKRYGNFTAIDNIEMDVCRGETMGLLGPNGSGKSTTLKSITGLLIPTSGEIYIDGINSITDHSNAMKTVGCVVETPECYPSFTPADALDYIGHIHGMSDNEIGISAKETLDELNMWEWRNKPIGKFSKGMRQRVALAQAMLSNPKIMILDEPTSGLDPRGMIEMREILRNLKKKDITMLISTHILKEVSELCESVTIINRGNIISSGKVDELINSTSRENGGITTIVAHTLLNITPEFIKNVSHMSGVVSTEKLNDNHLQIEFKGSLDEQADITELFFSSGLKPLSLDEKGADIEKMYMDLTKDAEGKVL